MEVYEEENAVVLPCLFPGLIPQDEPSVLWTRSDLSATVFAFRGKGDDPKKQRYSGRASMRPDALRAKNFSLTLRNPRLNDSGNYTCTIHDGNNKLPVGEVQLQVKGQNQFPAPAGNKGQKSYCRLGSEVKLKGIFPKVFLRNVMKSTANFIADAVHVRVSMTS